jgi:hypothetical protein
MIKRRDFLKTAALAGGIGAVKPIESLASRYQASTGFFGVHPFVENNPEAVFIMKTNVDVKTNYDGIRNAALDFTRSVIVPRENGVPLTHLIPIKPNITESRVGNIGKTLTGGKTPVTAEYLRGIVTNPFFVEGAIEAIKELGVSTPNIHVVETWDSGTWNALGYNDMAERTGVTMKSRQIDVTKLPESEIVWKDVDNGIWFKRIPYLYPVNAPDAWLLSIAKFKAHGMGITLCLKNIQGTIAQSYQTFCTGFGSAYSAANSDMNPQRNTIIQENYNRHKYAIPRWNKPGDWEGGKWMETWGSRTIDNNRTTKVGLSVIEGVYGRDGDGFLTGPNQGEFSSTEAFDYMTNIIIFGMNQVYVDIIGHWLAGHEPGNFGIFHLAKEHGLSSRINPALIPVYEWKPDGSASLTPLAGFTRTPLKTNFLQRNYNGGTEPLYHLCDEAYTYATDETPVLVEERPRTFLLSQNKPNPFNPSTSIQYTLPIGGQARLEVFNSRGQLVDVLVEGYRSAGSHMAVWNTSGKASGTYLYRFRSGGFTETKKMTLLK